MASQQAQSEFALELAQHGIDIVHASDDRWYNSHVADQSLQAQLKPLPDLCRQDGALAFLLGNSGGVVVLLFSHGWARDPTQISQNRLTSTQSLSLVRLSQSSLPLLFLAGHSQRRAQPKPCCIKFPGLGIRAIGWSRCRASLSQVLKAFILAHRRRKSSGTRSNGRCASLL